MSSLKRYSKWLIGRGRGRSARQLVRAAKRLTADREGYLAAIVDRNRSPNYRRTLAAMATTYAKFSNDTKLLARLRDIKLPAARPMTVREPLPLDVWAAVRASLETVSARTPLRLAACIVAARGLRSGDVLRLRRDEVQDAVLHGVLSFEGKGERRLTFGTTTFHAYLQGLLALSWPPSARLYNLVCPRSIDPEASASRAMRRLFDRVAQDLGMNPSLLFSHRLRHTVASTALPRLANDARALLILTEMMGWTSVSTAAHYLRASDAPRIREVEAALDALVKPKREN